MDTVILPDLATVVVSAIAAVPLGIGANLAFRLAAWFDRRGRQLTLDDFLPDDKVRFWLGQLNFDLGCWNAFVLLLFFLFAIGGRLG